MIEPERLKGKYDECAKNLWRDLRREEEEQLLGSEASMVFEDVRMAVLWLKKEVFKVYPEITDDVKPLEIIDKIDKAFEDVIE